MPELPSERMFNFFDTLSKSHKNTFLSLALLNLFAINFLSYAQENYTKENELRELTSNVKILYRNYEFYHILLDRLSIKIYKGHKVNSYKLDSTDHSLELWRSGRRTKDGSWYPFRIFHFSPLFISGFANLSDLKIKSSSYTLNFIRLRKELEETEKNQLYDIPETEIEKLKNEFLKVRKAEIGFSKNTNYATLSKYLDEFRNIYNSSLLYEQIRKTEGKISGRNTFYHIQIPENILEIENLSLRTLGLFVEYLDRKELSTPHQYAKMPITNIEIDPIFLQLTIPYFIGLVVFILLFYHEQINTNIKNADSVGELEVLASVMHSNPWIFGKLYVSAGAQFIIGLSIYLLGLLLTCASIVFHVYSIFFEQKISTLNYFITSILPSLMVLSIILLIIIRLFIYRRVILHSVNSTHSNLILFE